MTRFFKCCALVALAVLSVYQSAAQLPRKKKYPSLLWEITGNGMKKPSYLFGTMHISNKMVFHLPDSFYNAIKNVDVVALELSPELWQADIPRMNRQTDAYQRFASGYSDDYVHQNTFTEDSYIPQLQAALKAEPALNNSLLYRSSASGEDFEENTYLDLYIYQTGRKLGKRATGVESFMGSQRMAVEAYLDAATNKSKKKTRSDLNPYEVLQATQDAYRNGDLDALDSLDGLTEENAAFTEKFLYRRNDIQARSMDSIMHHEALFVGVGAAHLPGRRGVIEILRRKGYTLRPVRMQDRDAAQKDIIDSLRVPVRFTRQWSEDSAYRVAAPGQLQPLRGNSQQQMDYADMANGSYYLITRIKTHPLYTGATPAKALRVADSLFYEAIPGKILTKTLIEKNGAKGYEITNRTRRGDLQRYQLFAMPAEIIIFKMGGTEDYVGGPEADSFFNSIQLKNYTAQAGYRYGPKEGGYHITFPQKPVAEYDYRSQDGEPRTTAEATIAATGESFAMMKKDIYTFRFLDKDTFCASLGLESALNDVEKSSILERRSSAYQGYAAADAIVRAKNGQYIHYRSVVQGPQQFLLAARTADRNSPAAEAFLNSLRFVPTQYGAPIHVRDTFLKIDVTTPIAMEMDNDVAALIAYSRSAAQKVKAQSGDYSNNPEERKANFFSESTGELVTVETAMYPAYYYSRKSKTFWSRILDNATNDSDMVLQKSEALSYPDGISGYSLTISDTGSSRIIRRVVLLKGMTLYTISAEIDGKMGESDFVHSFLSTVRPFDVSATPAITDSKSTRFFADYYNRDSLTHARAVDAISTTYFGPEGYPKIVEAISRLKPGTAEYYTLKPKFIRELGYLSDSTNDTRVLATLKAIYKRSGDTSWIQNEVLTAMQHLRTKEATTAFRELLVQDPPVFDNASDYTGIFSTYEDTLQLGAQLFPDVLQLASIADFKPAVISLLANEVDSGYVKPAAYQSMLSNIAFDAKIALKKEMNEDESAREATARREAQDETDGYSSSTRNLPANDTARGVLYDYAVLLAPYYDQNPAVPRFFDKMLSVRTPETRLYAALLLKRNNQPVPDSIWSSLASNKLYRGRLYEVLNRAGMLRYFPGTAPTQEERVRSGLYAQVSDIKNIRLVGRQTATVDGKSGIVYTFRYRKRGASADKLAINGPQPADDKDYDDDPKLNMTDLDVKGATSTDKQITALLAKSRISFQPAGRQFYNSNTGGDDAFLRMMQQSRAEE